jgi:glycosyltransferase involved in cell wall biosynthesis
MKRSIKILFVSSGNNKNFKITPFIKSQGESLKKRGIFVDYYTIKGKGILGYLKNVFPIRNHIKENEYDLIHAHYSLTGWVSVFSFTPKVPKVVSFMGCDTYGDYDENGKFILSSIINIIAAKILQFFVKYIIVKSAALEKYVNFKKKTYIIPNGVNISKFTPLQQAEARKKIGLDYEKKYILFLGDKNDMRKNFKLLKTAHKHLNDNVEILNPYPLQHDWVPLYLNACDVLALCSFREGSPNVIKEALACNVPIVSTRVGDVETMLNDTEGCYLSDFDPYCFSGKLLQAINFSSNKGKTNGRRRIMSLGLDETTISKQIMEVYKEAIMGKKSKVSYTNKMNIF